MEALVSLLAGHLAPPTTRRKRLHDRRRLRLSFQIGRMGKNVITFDRFCPLKISRLGLLSLGRSWEALLLPSIMRTRVIYVCLAVLALFLSASSGSARTSNEKYKNEANHHAATTKNQSAYATPPPTIIVQPAPVTIIQSASSAKEQIAKQSWYQPASVTDWGILVITLLYTGLSLGLLSASRRQANLAREALLATQQAANAASEGATAAIESNRQHRELAEKELRAYVNLNGGKILNVKVPSARIARITIRNFGRTPAHHLRFGIGVHVEELPLKSPLPAKMPTSIGPRLDILAPHRISTLEVTIPILNALEENMLQTSRAAIHVFGKVTYLDAFGIDRFSAFCLFCVGDGLPEGRLVPCQEGNDSN